MGTEVLAQLVECFPGIHKTMFDPPAPLKLSVCVSVIPLHGR